MLKVLSTLILLPLIKALFLDHDVVAQRIERVLKTMVLSSQQSHCDLVMMEKGEGNKSYIKNGNNVPLIFCYKSCNWFPWIVAFKRKCGVLATGLKVNQSRGILVQASLSTSLTIQHNFKGTNPFSDTKWNITWTEEQAVLLYWPCISHPRTTLG